MYLYVDITTFLLQDNIPLPFLFKMIEITIVEWVISHEIFRQYVVKTKKAETVGHSISICYVFVSLDLKIIQLIENISLNMFDKTYFVSFNLVSAFVFSLHTSHFCIHNTFILKYIRLVSLILLLRL